ncbi:MAG: flagellar biosynthetic protein FliO [Pseudomonadota bacterium]
MLGVMTSALLATPSAWAADNSAQAPGVSSGMMLQTGLGLLLILGLLFLAAYLLKKNTSGRGFGAAHNPLRSVGGLMIGTRERVVLLEIGDTWLLVGVGPSQIRTLHTMPKGTLEAASQPEQPFALWLKQILERKNAGK